MSGHLWTRHWQRGWDDKAANPNIPLWLRVACFAYGRHEANGHAIFQRGALMWMLGTPPKNGQPFKKRDSATVRDAIKLAVSHGWLAEGSCSECLIVPGHQIEGPPGNPSKPCPVHERKYAHQRAKRLAPAACRN